MEKFYCVKCKTHKEVKENITEATAKNGRKMKQSVCPDCKTKLNKFVSTK